eukprot:CAMPEP_0119398408 /NCGR_PEP_ID=MMETSP1334-20130426/140827_1 /TAXON_ID=127549 /ORGANISM="Calcidiscus leptoporus, Strain RCC1130" /LENGTH=194 /DNA_ID=CAMNT_0007422267 /DNA_START=984 /DNA_END=1570 /DNA_ORIENTATION=-
MVSATHWAPSGRRGGGSEGAHGTNLRLAGLAVQTIRCPSVWVWGALGLSLPLLRLFSRREGGDVKDGMDETSQGRFNKGRIKDEITAACAAAAAALERRPAVHNLFSLMQFSEGPASPAAPPSQRGALASSCAAAAAAALGEAPPPKAACGLVGAAATPKPLHPHRARARSAQAARKPRRYARTAICGRAVQPQ